jgi:glutamate synthase (NADPH/NADH) small chain
VWDALDFIERVKCGAGVGDLGSHVAVIGAGNTAIDALTSAKRLGVPNVTMYYRRTEREMTAYLFEYEFAKQEGVEFRWLCAPLRIIGRDGRVSGVEFVRTRLDGDTSARSLPQPVPGSEFAVAAQTVIRAIGQSRLTALLDELGVQHRHGIVSVDDALRTTHPKVFAAGDCIFAKGAREAMVVEAAEQGKLAAAGVHRWLLEIANGESHGRSFL